MAHPEEIRVAIQSDALPTNTESVKTSNQPPDMGRHTFPSSRLRILRTSNLPLRLIINLNNEHNRQISTTRRGALLRASSQKRFCAAC